MRDRNQYESKEADCVQSTRNLSLRERLEIRRTRAQEIIKHAQAELSQVENGLKLLDKNKQLETLVNLIQL